jgi:hypothetical protein
MALIINIIIYFLIAILAAVLAFAAIKLFKIRNKGVYVIAFILCFAALRILANMTFMPSIRVWNIERELNNIPVYKTISATDPDIYQAIKKDMALSVKKGESREVIIGKVRKRISQLVKKYLPRASVKALRAYITVIVKELEALASKDPDLCFKFLYPEQYGYIDITPHIDKRIKEADLSALKEVLETASKNPQPLPDPEAADKILISAIKKLRSEYGEDILILSDAASPDVDKGKFCTITTALYRQLLSLPDEQFAMAIRHMMTP